MMCVVWCQGQSQFVGYYCYCGELVVCLVGEVLFCYVGCVQVVNGEQVVVQLIIFWEVWQGWLCYGGDVQYIKVFVVEYYVGYFFYWYFNDVIDFVFWGIVYQFVCVDQCVLQIVFVVYGGVVCCVVFVVIDMVKDLFVGKIVGCGVVVSGVDFVCSGIGKIECFVGGVLVGGVRDDNVFFQYVQ